MIKRLLIIFIIIFMSIGILSYDVLARNYRYKEEPNSSKLVRAAVLLRRPKDPFIEAVRENLEAIQAESPDKIQFEFYYSEAEEEKQNKILDEVLTEGIDLIIIQLADIRKAEGAINKMKENNVPVVVFNREPVPLDPVKSYSKSLYIGTEGSEAGTLQGQIIIAEWIRNKERIDKNRDGKIQYIMLTGEPDNLEAIERTKYSVDTIEKAGIKTDQLALRVCNWEESLAKEATRSLFFRYGNNIEAVIANNDAMAIGAIKVLQEYGYNKGDERMTIPVVGVDAVEEARDYIAKNYMLGTVVQDDKEMAKAIYLTGMNFVFGRNPLEGTPYKFDKTGVAIRIPYAEYIANIE